MVVLQFEKGEVIITIASKKSCNIPELMAISHLEKCLYRVVGSVPTGLTGIS